MKISKLPVSAQNRFRELLKIMNIRSASDVLGCQVVRILDPTVFLKVRDSGRDVRDLLIDERFSQHKRAMRTKKSPQYGQTAR